MPLRPSSAVPSVLAVLILANPVASEPVHMRQGTRTAPATEPGSLPDAERRVPDAAVGEPPGSRVYVPHADVAWALRRALRDVAARLKEPGCQGLLTDFRDEHGHSLATNLARGAGELSQYLGWVVFVDGRDARACDKGAVAVTQPGSRVVRVCSSKFLWTWQQDPLIAVAVLIHELLHTLGLGENPPSSDEITSAVRKRCMMR